MGYKITTDDKRKLVIVKYDNEITLDDRRLAVAEATAKLESSGYRIALVDMSDASMREHSAEEKSDFAMLISRNETLKKCHVAYLTKAHQHNNHYIEILAHARHFRFKHFTDLEAAKLWLSQYVED